ncbi:MAG: helix-turn-helix domain-containing protein [Candidatus Cryptobacteroides sp.]
MNLTLYRCSLLVALPLMLFFGFHMLLALVPPTRNSSNYLLSRRIMGSALLALAVNYTIHLLLNPRAIDQTATILMNMVTYFLCYWLFSSALITLLDRAYVTKRRFTMHLLLWSAYSLSAIVVCFLNGPLQTVATSLMALCLLAYGLFMSYNILKRYRKATRLFADTHSDDIGAYIQWLSVFTWWAITFGVGCSLLTFLPDRYVFIWVLSAIPFYIYMYCCYQNYLFFYEDVEKAIDEDDGADEQIEGLAQREESDVLSLHPDISRRIDEWVATDGYITPGITLSQLSTELGTNRTYLSEYINKSYGVTFRDWISALRIEYAKRLMAKEPQMRIQEVSESSGFRSLSHFSRTFSEKEGCSPAKWRQNRP